MILNPERKSCAFKNIQIRVDGALVSSMKRTLVETLRKGSLSNDDDDFEDNG